MKKMNLSRDRIHSKVYPRKRRMTRTRIRENFWDFYALELLRAKSKGSYLQHQRMGNLLKEVTVSLLREQIMALEASIRGEIRYFIRACRSPKQSSNGCWVSDFLVDVYKKYSPLTIDLATIEAIFKKKIWSSEYGGRNWARATRTLIEAKQAFKDDDLRSMIYYVDRIFDLQHNNGFILNKTNFRVLDDECDLGSRHGLRSIKTLRNYKISKRVRGEVESFAKCA